MYDGLRPGIYTDYIIEPYSTGKGRSIGVVAQSGLDNVEEIVKITSYLNAKTIYGQQNLTNNMLVLLGSIFNVSSPNVYAASVNCENEDYSQYFDAIDTLIENEDVYLIICDIYPDEIKNYLKNAVSNLNCDNPKLAVIALDDYPESADTPQYYNSNRILLSSPKITFDQNDLNVSNAVLAAMISDCDDINSNLIGESVQGRFYIGSSPTEAQVDTALRYGVNVFEQYGNSIELIKGVTTKTLDEDLNTDNTFRNLSVTLILDTVLPEIKNTLKSKISRFKNNLTSLDTIKSLVVCCLRDYADDGIISEYSTPVVYLDSEESTTAIINLSFAVAEGLSQIYINANISV